MRVVRQTDVATFAAAAVPFLITAEAENLFTDLANPTSNSIYAKIGFRPVCDFDVYRFERRRSRNTQLI